VIDCGAGGVPPGVVEKLRDVGATERANAGNGTARVCRQTATLMDLQTPNNNGAEDTIRSVFVWLPGVFMMPSFFVAARNHSLHLLIEGWTMRRSGAVLC
jgi:hypothetical protein